MTVVPFVRFEQQSTPVFPHFMLAAVHPACQSEDTPFRRAGSNMGGWIPEKVSGTFFRHCLSILRRLGRKKVPDTFSGALTPFPELEPV